MKPTYPGMRTTIEFLIALCIGIAGIVTLSALCIVIYKWAAPEQPRPSRYHEFKLDDGTRCVMTYRGALDCDWRGKK